MENLYKRIKRQAVPVPEPQPEPVPAPEPAPAAGDDDPLPPPFDPTTAPAPTPTPSVPRTTGDDTKTTSKSGTDATTRGNTDSTTSRNVSSTTSSTRTTSKPATSKTPSPSTSSIVVVSSTSAPSTVRAGTGTGTLASESMIWPNSFPPNFPVETHTPDRLHSGGRGYAFLKENELLDSLLLFLSFIITALILTVVLIKSTHAMSRRSGSKGDQMVGEDMKWAERREVLERKIVWESGRGAGAGRGGMGKSLEARVGWRELSERERERGTANGKRK